MHPKIRSPFLSWLLTVATGGLYLIYWAWRVASELNYAENREVFRTDLWRKTAIVLFLLSVVGFVVAVETHHFVSFMVIASCLLAFLLYVQVSIGNYIIKKDIQLGTGHQYSHAISLVLLWLVANTGVAYMQSGINRVIRHEQARS